MNPSNSWYEFIRVIHFDRSTGLAVINISDSDVPLWVDQLQATEGIMNYITRINRENGCTGELSQYQQFIIDNPEWGDAIDIAHDEVPVFHACGVTPQSILMDSKVPFAITHSAGHMFVTDLPSDMGV